MTKVVIKTYSRNRIVMEKKEKRNIVIMGATSGLGRRLAEAYIVSDWRVGVAGRNVGKLEELCRLAPERVEMAQIDITRDEAAGRLLQLVERLGGMDVYVHCSGILTDEEELSEESQMKVINTNAKGFAGMISAAYRYFSNRQHKESATGNRQRYQIAAISSIAGIRGLAQLPAYSAAKAFDIHYLEALRQRADAEGLRLKITDIRPGWTRTPLLNAERKYMLEMDEEDVAKKIFKVINRGSNKSVIGKRWKVLTGLQRNLPTWLWTRLHLPLWK